MNPSDIRPAIANMVLAFVGEAGADAEALASSLGFPWHGGFNSSTMPPFATELRLWEAAADCVGDPFFGVHVAQRIQRGTFGPLEFICRTAATLGEAMDIIVKYYPLIQPDMSVSCYVVDGATVVQQRINQHGHRCRQVNEFFLAMILLHGQLLSRTRFKTLRVWFANPRPADLSELQQIFGTSNFEFAASSSGLAVDERARTLPIVSSDQPLHAVLEGMLAKYLPSPKRNDPVIRTRRLIAETLHQRVPSIDWVARTLGVSVRTLQRQLDAERWTFRSLTEDVRAELARVYVADENRAIGEIPYLLGYAEPRHFFRSFKRWTGTTPTEFRRSRQG